MPKCKCGCKQEVPKGATWAHGHNMIGRSPERENSLSTMHIAGPISKRQRPRGKPKIDRFVAENGMTYEQMCESHREMRDRVLASLA